MSDKANIEIKSKEELDLLYSALANSPASFDDVSKDTEIRNSLIERIEKMLVIDFASY